MTAKNEDEGRLLGILFPNGVALSDSQRSQLLELYKLFVQTSESLVQRRQSVNAFFITVNSLLLTGVGLFANTGLKANYGGAGLVALGMTGAIASIAWARLVRSYRQLNTGKFRIINLLETQLPAAMFQAEWEALGEGKDHSKYRPFTATEPVIAHVFVVLYAVVVALGILSILGQTQALFS
jgi:hypothetical protein